MNEQYNNDPIINLDTPPRRRASLNRLAFALIILGLCLFGAGWMTGARGGRVYITGGFRVVPNYHANMTTGMDMTAANEITAIVVNSSSGAIQLTHTNENRMHMSTTRRGITMSEENGTLYVDSRNVGHNVGILGGGNLGVSIHRGRGQDTSMNFNFDRRSLSRGLGNTVRIYVPNSVNNIYARTQSGSVSMSGVSTNQLHLESSSGSVRLDGGTHNNVYMETRSGSVRANGNFSGDITGISRSGSVRIEDSSSSHAGNNIRLSARSGSVRFYTTAPRNNFSYSMSVGSGSMRIDGNRLNGRDYSGGSGNVHIDASTGSGSIQLNFGR